MFTINCKKSTCLIIISTMGFCFGIYLLSLWCDTKQTSVINIKDKIINCSHDDKKRVIPYDRNISLIFIGGTPRSGTTLMRVMLDAHPDVRCGEESRVIPRILGMNKKWQNVGVEKRRLDNAGITREILDSAISAFMLEIIIKHGYSAPTLCNKDPLALTHSEYLAKLFPKAKFLFMIRDGRAVVHSIMSRRVTIKGVKIKNYKSCMKFWNKITMSIYEQCLRIGASRCLPIYYEKLVLYPEHWMKLILQFLQLPWNSSVLHHEDYVGKPGGISLSRLEKSTDQVIHPVNKEALSKWVGSMPEDIKRQIEKLAPMLRTLGYDPYAYPPQYENLELIFPADKTYVQHL